MPKLHCPSRFSAASAAQAMSRPHHSTVEADGEMFNTGMVAVAES
jgi:hypothetical protein